MDQDGIVGVLSILSWIFLERKRLLHSSQERGIQNNITGVLLTLLALVAVIIINIVAVRYNQKYDFTTKQKYTLSDQSLSILHNLQKPITVKTYFLSTSPEHQDFQVLQDNVEQETTQIQSTNVDPLKTLYKRNKITLP